MKRVCRTISILPSVWAAIEELAAREDRSASRVIELALKNHCLTDGEEPPCRERKSKAACK